MFVIAQMLVQFLIQSSLDDLCCQHFQQPIRASQGDTGILGLSYYLGDGLSLASSSSIGSSGSGAWATASSVADTSDDSTTLVAISVIITPSTSMWGNRATYTVSLTDPVANATVRCSLQSGMGEASLL